MRIQILIGAVATLGVLLGVACSSSEVIGGADPDGGGSSSGTSGGGGPADGGGSSNGNIPLTPSRVKQGPAFVVGVTADEHIVYATPTTIEAVPVAGGTPEVIETEPAYDETTVAVVSGGAVGYWTAVGAGRGTFNVWTKAGGTKRAIATNSGVGVFRATEDGARIAFSVEATEDSTNLAVASSATVAAPVTGIFAPDSLINAAAARPPSANEAAPCPVDIGFAGAALIAGFCVGTSPTETNGRLYRVAEGSTTPVRLDTVGAAAGPVRPLWRANKDGTKIAAIGLAPTNTGRLILAPSTSVALENDVATITLVGDDSVVYRSDTTGLRRATLGETPAPKTLVASAKTVLGVSSDLSRVLVRTLEPTADGVDIRSCDTTTENQTPVAIVPTASAIPAGFTGSGQYVVYLTDRASGGMLRAQPSGGGAETELVVGSTGIAIPPVGNGVVALLDRQVQNQVGFVSLKYYDSASGDSSPVFAVGVPEESIAFSKDRLVYVQLIEDDAGIFTAPMTP